MNNIELIAIEKLQHHPDNPRKDFGDLDELAESIKANGIMQNLTVVRSDDGTGLYDVIIGNRRLEAAKLAELDELPCVVVEMSPQEQMATMLAENMQREDLTILEQAQGFQYMLDLGETAKTISEKTGFSASTVRRRVKLLELDADKLEKAFGRRQISLEDVDKINSIDNVGNRNKLLEQLGTPNFDWSFKRAKDEQNQRAMHKKVRELLKSSGLKEVKYGADWGPNSTKDRVGNANLNANASNEELKKSVSSAVEKNSKKSDSFALDGSSLYFYREKKAKSSTKDTAKEKEREHRQRNAEELKRASKSAYELRLEFIKSYSKAQAKKHLKDILAALARAAVDVGKDGWNVDRYYYKSSMFAELSGIDTTSKEKFDASSAKVIGDASEKMLLDYVYALSGDSEYNNYVAYNGSFYDNFQKNPKMDWIYVFLETLGYEMSDTEKSLQDGTNELFYKPNSKGDGNGK